MTHPKCLGIRLVKITVAALIAAAFMSFAVNHADAQLRPWNSSNEVLVDMSVLGDNGVGPGPVGSISLPSLTGEVLDPPSKMPRSRLLATRPPMAGAYGEVDLPPVKLKKPKRRSSSKKKSRKTRAKMIPKKKVAAMKSAPPKPGVKAPAAAKKKAARKLAPAPKAQPKPDVKVADMKKSAPPKPSAAPPPPPAIKAPEPAAKKPDASKSQPSQQASAPAGAKADQAVNVVFASGDAKLSDAGKQTLDNLAAKLKAAPNSRMQLLAYAGEPNLSASKARRLSLSRALSVRTFLISKGVRSTRIDVRALGNKVPGGQPNRVDLRVLSR